MFTPPSSPPPPRNEKDSSPSFIVNLDDGQSCEESESPLPFSRATAAAVTAATDRKRALGRRTTLATVILLPFLLFLITVVTRFFMHPTLLDVLSSAHIPPDWRTWKSTATDWRLHKRHADSGLWAGGEPPSSSSSSLLSSSPSSPSSPLPPSSQVTSMQFPSQPLSSSTQTRPTGTSSHSSAQQLPTVPAGPIVVPTPFPAPFDTSLQQNFSSVSCYNFFLNMTNSIPFRSCRPFSLLLQSSQAFINAQSNFTLLNEVVWGICNTQISEPQCVENMAWFTSSLRTSCQSDLNDRNAVVSSTLIALQAFKLMQDSGCLVDQATNTYCYVEAAFNPNPSDLYFYELPLGIRLPNTTTATCSGCTKTMMGLFNAALGDSTQAGNLRALKSVYGLAAHLADAECGQSYAAGSSTSSSIVTISPLHSAVWTCAMLVLVCSLSWAR